MQCWESSHHQTPYLNLVEGNPEDRDAGLEVGQYWAVCHFQGRKKNGTE